MSRPNFVPGESYQLRNYGLMYVWQERRDGRGWFSFAQIQPPTPGEVIKHRVLCDQTTLDGDFVSTTGDVVTIPFDSSPRRASARRFLEKVAQLAEPKGYRDRHVSPYELLEMVEDIRHDL